MAQEYKITKVSQQPPRTWEGQHGTVYYIKVALEGHNKPVEVGKKSPNALKVGDTIYGDIQPSDYPSDRFKGAKKPYGGSTKGERVRTDTDAIQAQFAIKTSVAFHGENATMQDIEATAKTFFAMIDRVKGSTVVTHAKPQKEQVNNNVPEDDAEFQSLIGSAFDEGGDFIPSDVPI